MLAVSDREQRHFGRELHDGLCQQLFSAAVACDRLREKLASQLSPEAAEAGRLLAKLDAAMTEARALAGRLSLPHLAGPGLTDALRDLARATSRDYQVICEARCEGTKGIQDPTVAAHLYRIAREAVHNAIRHAKPRRIAIWLTIRKREGRLRVVDDGIGLEKKPGNRPGMGLDIMKWRAGVIGGDLDLRRATPGETMVICNFPVALRRRPAQARKAPFCGRIVKSSKQKELC